MSVASNRPGSSARRDLLLALYPLGLLTLVLGLLLARPRVGPLALALVFAPYLFLPLLLLLPAALRRDRFLLRMALGGAAAVFLILAPPALSLPRSPSAAPQLRAMSWNMFVGGASVAQLRAALAEHQPDLVALQEIDWFALAADEELAARYPYRLLRPEETAPSLAILSRYPIIEAGVPELAGPEWDMPRLVWARLDVGGRAVIVVNAHPIPPRTFDEGCSLLRCYNIGPRDAQIARFRAFVQSLRARGEPLLLLGDMNVSEREEAYLDLAAGLTDAHRAAGAGFGFSWRPLSLSSVPLIRIDYMFSADGLRPLGLATDCASRGSDHCLIVGDFDLAG